VDEVKFWEIIQITHDKSGGDMDCKCEAIKSAIEILPKNEAIIFSRIFDEMQDKAYTWPLWGAAYIINGGCGDDTFSDFRASLISRGKQAFEKSISNPDSLADDEFDEDKWFYEGYQYAVTDGIEAASGSVQPRSKPHPEEPSGEEWEEEQLDELFPKLSTKFA